MSGRETNLSVSPAGLSVPGGSQPLWGPAALLADAQFTQTWTLLSTFVNYIVLTKDTYNR